MAAFLAIVHNMVMLVGILYISQFVVGIFNWPARENNAIYRFFRFLTSPITKAVRAITPEKVQDKHVPAVAFFLLFWLYIALFFARVCTHYPHLCQ
jgi:DNA phosphorothioation-dependent restriction protein DptG